MLEYKESFSFACLKLFFVYRYIFVSFLGFISYNIVLYFLNKPDRCHFINTTFYQNYVVFQCNCHCCISCKAALSTLFGFVFLCWRGKLLFNMQCADKDISIVI